MRVLLIIPTSYYKYIYPAFMSNTDFPVGFAYLASALRSAGHEVHGLNPNNDPNYGSAYEMLYEKISRSLQESQPELIGLGGLCTDFKFLKDAIQIIRTLAPDVKIVCGGGIINNDAEFVFQTLRPDFCIIEEGEEILVQLVNMLESGSQDYEQIVNLGYWERDTPKFTRQDFNYIDINRRCFPDYEPFGIDEMFDEYSLASRFPRRYTRANPRPMTIVTARSCPFKCTFCVHQRGARYRVRSVENIIQEIDSLYERYHFNILLILDELFAVNKLRLREFCLALIDARNKRGWDFDWTFQTHASASLDIEALKLAKRAGCYCFSYGLESASPRVLASMGKKTKPLQIIEAIKIADAAKIGFGGNFIFGDVAETMETVSETMDFFSRYCLDNHIYLGYIQPYPGSKLFQDCIERGIIRNKLEFYEHIDEGIVNMTSMPDELWIPWVKQLASLGSSFSWLKSVNASCCIKEAETANTPMVLHSGRPIYNVWTKCPHCEREVHYREPLDNTRRLRYRPFDLMRLIKARGLRHFLFAFMRSIRARGKRGNSTFVTSINPLYKLLKPLMAREKQACRSFVTGCPYCNKLFRVRIPQASCKNPQSRVLR